MMNSTSRPLATCQICGSSRLESVLFLGFIPPVNTMPDVDSVPTEQSAYPLELMRCSECTLVQIRLEVAPEVLFPFSYPYLSGTTRILRENFAELYKHVRDITPLDKNSLVIDIGSNDGTLLSNFHSAGHRVLGIEPSQAGLVAREKGIETLTAYFHQRTAQEVSAKYGKAQVITAANVFAHIGDIHSVVDGITEALSDDGIFVSESHYLLSLVDTLQYDTIYHEHLRHYSLRSLIYLLERHDLEVFHVELIPTHGGSIRAFAAKKGKRTVLSSVGAQLAIEDQRGLTDGSLLQNFRQRALESKCDLYALLAPLKRAGSHIYGIGAPSRASTLINYTGLDDGIIDCVMEVRDSHKLNKYVPGTRIPVLDEQKLYDDQPDYALLLSWHITDELVRILRKNGFKGKFISPLPHPRIIES